MLAGGGTGIGFAQQGMAERRHIRAKISFFIFVLLYLLLDTRIEVD